MYAYLIPRPRHDSGAFSEKPGFPSPLSSLLHHPLLFKFFLAGMTFLASLQRGEYRSEPQGFFLESLPRVSCAPFSPVSPPTKLLPLPLLNHHPRFLSAVRPTSVFATDSFWFLVQTRTVLSLLIVYPHPTPIHLLLKLPLLQLVDFRRERSFCVSFPRFAFSPLLDIHLVESAAGWLFLCARFCPPPPLSSSESRRARQPSLARRPVLSARLLAAAEGAPVIAS